jgi:signal transduction histidine kinase/ActR/RegA family two-component response regulator
MLNFSPKDINSELKRKRFIIYVFSFTALLFLLIFFFRGLQQGRYPYIYIILGFFVLALSNVIYLRISQNIKLTGFVIVSLMFVLNLLLFSFLGKETTGLYWFYIFPILTISLFGYKRGILASFALVALSTLIYLFEPPFLKNIYSFDLYFRFLMTYFVAIVLISIYEYARHLSFLAYTSRMDKFHAQNQELRIKEEQLELARNKAEESNRLKSAFLANMSHEIRTPLNAIVGFSELLDNQVEERHKEYSKIIINSGHHLSKIINDIIDISKIESQQIKLHETSFSLNELLNDVADAYHKRLYPEVDIVLDIFWAEGSDSINTDYTRLRQILTNLVSNAVKFTKQGQIIISYLPKDGHLYFEVKDSGIGISQEDINVIFDRFTRSFDSEKNVSHKGTGLGLAITKSCVELLSGEISVKSKVGEGTTFFFSIPLKREIRSKQKLATKKEKKVSNAVAKVLIAEDDLNSFEFLKIGLSSSFPDITHAKNGKELLEEVQLNDYDIVLADIRMPVMNGNEAVEKIREFNTSIPIIAQTANAFEEDKNAALEAGCNAFVTKPVNIKDLVELMNDLLEKRQN